MAGLASCNKFSGETAKLEPSLAPSSFEVSVPGTKTALSGLNVLWAAGDEIRVYGHNTSTDTYTDNAVYELTSGAGDGTATFTIKDGESMSGTYDEYYAVYPGNLTATLTSTTMALPRLNSSPNHMREQNPSAGQYDPNLAIMTAKYDGSRLVFRHGVAYIKLTIPDDDVTKVDINFTNNCLADTPTYNLSSGALSSVGNSSKNVTSSTGTFTKGVTYYFPAIPRAGNDPGETVITLTGGATYRTNHFSGVSLVVGEVYDLGTPSKGPAIVADNVDIDADDTGGTINFTVANLVDGGVVTKEVLAGATISNLNLGAVSFNTGTGAGSISFTCDENDDASNAKTATVRVTYTYNTDQTATKDITITQRKKGSVSFTYTWDFTGLATAETMLTGVAGNYDYEYSNEEGDGETIVYTARNDNKDKIGYSSSKSFIQPNGASNGSNYRYFTYSAPAAGVLRIQACSNGSSAKNLTVTLAGATVTPTSGGSSSSSTPSLHVYSISAAGTVKIYADGTVRYYSIVYSNE